MVKISARWVEDSKFFLIQLNYFVIFIFLLLMMIDLYLFEIQLPQEYMGYGGMPLLSSTYWIVRFSQLSGFEILLTPSGLSNFVLMFSPYLTAFIESKLHSDLTSTDKALYPQNNDNEGERIMTHRLYSKLPYGVNLLLFFIVYILLHIQLYYKQLDYMFADMAFWRNTLLIYLFIQGFLSIVILKKNEYVLPVLIFAAMMHFVFTMMMVYHTNSSA